MRTEQRQHSSLSPANQRVYWGALRRLKSIRDELAEGRYPNRSQLAAALGSKVRTVQRDLDFLRDQLQAPIEYNRLERGYYLTDPDWQLPEVSLTEGELISFFVAEHLLRQLGDTSPEVKLARAAVTRLAALLPDEVVVDLDALATSVSFAPAPALEASPDTLRRLTEAATRRETLSVHYFSQRRNAPTNRELNVLGLHQALGEWYAIAEDLSDNRQIKVFHAGRFKQLESTGRNFTPPDDWAEQKQGYLQRGFGMFMGGAPVNVVVDFDEYQARYVRERSFHPTQRRDELPDGGVRLTFEATEAALGQVARWAMQYGEHAVVREPAALREMVRKQLKKTLNLYES